MPPAASGAPSQWPSPHAWRNPSAARKPPPRSACYASHAIVRQGCLSKYFDVAQRMFPVAAGCCVAAKYAGETALFAGVITADAREHTGWNHGTVLPSKICAIIFCHVRPDNVAKAIAARYEPKIDPPDALWRHCCPIIGPIHLWRQASG